MRQACKSAIDEELKLLLDKMVSETLEHWLERLENLLSGTLFGKIQNGVQRAKADAEEICQKWNRKVPFSLHSLRSADSKT